MKLSLESFNPGILPKHLFGFYMQMHLLMFHSKPEWNYQFEFKKENKNNPKSGKMRRLRIHPTVEMRKMSLIHQSLTKLKLFIFTLQTWLPFQLRRRPTCHPMKKNLYNYTLNVMNKTAARYPR